MDFSSLFSHQSMKIENEIVFVQILKFPKPVIYQKLLKTKKYNNLKLESPIKNFSLSKSYFYKLIQKFKIFKQVKKLTDLWPICELLSKPEKLTPNEIKDI